MQCAINHLLKKEKSQLIFSKMSQLPVVLGAARMRIVIFFFQKKNWDLFVHEMFNLFLLEIGIYHIDETSALLTTSGGVSQFLLKFIYTIVPILIMCSINPK